MTNLMELSTAVIAYGTIIGVVGALGTLLLEFGFSSLETGLFLIIYILVTLLFIAWLGGKIK